MSHSSFRRDVISVSNWAQISLVCNSNIIEDELSHQIDSNAVCIFSNETHVRTPSNLLSYEHHLHMKMHNCLFKWQNTDEVNTKLRTSDVCYDPVLFWSLVTVIKWRLTQLYCAFSSNRQKSSKRTKSVMVSDSINLTSRVILLICSFQYFFLLLKIQTRIPFVFP